MPSARSVEKRAYADDHEFREHCQRRRWAPQQFGKGLIGVLQNP